jgi:hypothetical protein
VDFCSAVGHPPPVFFLSLSFDLYMGSVLWVWIFGLGIWCLALGVALILGVKIYSNRGGFCRLGVMVWDDVVSS